MSEMFLAGWIDSFGTINPIYFGPMPSEAFTCASQFAVERGYEVVIFKKQYVVVPVTKAEVA